MTEETVQQEQAEELHFCKGGKERKKEFRLSAIMMGLSFLMLVFSIVSEQPSVLAFLLFLALFILGCRQMYKAWKNEPSVLVNRDGITSKVNLMGTVPWEYIEGFELKEGVNASFVVVHVNRPTELLEGKSRVVRGLMNSNIKRLGSPVVLAGPLFGTPLEEVLEHLQVYRKRVVD